MPKKENELTIETVARIDHAVLSRLAYEEAEMNEGFARRLLRAGLRRDAKALEKACKKAIASIRRGRRFIPYGESFEYARTISDLADDIHNNVTDKVARMELLEALIATDSKTYLRSDDSAGAIGAAYETALAYWRELIPSMEEERLYTAMSELMYCDGFGRREIFSDAIPDAVMQRLYDTYMHRTHRNEWDASNTLSVLEICAFHLKNPLLYEAALKQFQKPLEGYELIRLATIAEHAGDMEGVLAYLDALPRPGAGVWLEAYASLRLKALERLGRREERRELLRYWFDQTASPKVLERYLEMLGADERGEAIRSVLAKTHEKSFAEAMSVFKVLDAGTEAAAYIFANPGNIRTGYQSRRDLEALSKWLAEHDPEAAILLWRDVVKTQLETRQSKYYPYAVKALEMIASLIENAGVIQWKTEAQDRYLCTLFEQHRSKPKFVSLYLETFGVLPEC